MARIFGRPDGKAPRIDRSAINGFFATRAEKSATVGSLSTVIYQDKNPDLAVRRNAAEKALLLQKLTLTSGLRVLDLGCGNGRWTADVLAADCAYVGVDQSAELISLARQSYPNVNSARFVVCPIETTRLAAISEASPFDRILCLGVLIYLNDDELALVSQNLPELASASSKLIFREPVGIGQRLTIQDHHSSDMDQIYNAIYRTESELLDILSPSLVSAGFKFSGSGDVYDGELNNREDTRQRWMIFER